MSAPAITPILEGRLYLGDRDDASNRRLLKHLGITHVVNCAKEQPNFFCNQLRYYNCNLNDDPAERIDFDGPTWFIQAALAQGGVVLVHCMAGVSRAATIVTAFLMKAYGMSLREALQKVGERRPCIDPNPNYLRQLTNLEGGNLYAQRNPYYPSGMASNMPNFAPPTWPTTKPRSFSHEMNQCTIS